MTNFRQSLFGDPLLSRGARRLRKESFGGVLFLLLAVGCLGNTAAWAQEFDTVYQLQTSGLISQITCSGSSCGGSTLLDNNSASSSITSGGGGLFQMQNTNAIWEYTGTPCSSGCPGWLELDNNPSARMIAAGSGFGGNPFLFQLHSSGSIWQFTGTPCSGGNCPGWIELDSNSATTQIIAAGGTVGLCGQSGCSPNIPPLVQFHSDGSIWQYTGTPCGNGCNGWQKLDNNPAAVQIFGFVSGGGGAGAIFQLHNDGSIWKYTGTPCGPSFCSGWSFLASAPSAKQILTAETSGRLFVLNTDGGIWEFTSSGWIKRDGNPATIQIAASDNGLFQLHNDGSVWWLGANGWVPVSNNPATKAIAASSFVSLR